MDTLKSKFSLLTAILCLAFTTQAQVTNPNPSTFEIRLNTTTGTPTTTDHLILGTEVTQTTTPNNPGGLGPESTSTLT